ncbi:hypothetical protein [Roseicella frigidaeris]|nr:hypothetical protein [Roseicella frigidaeris]
MRSENFDPSPYAGFLMRKLLRPCGGSPSGPIQAVAETELQMDGDTWVWTDDNAKVVEMLARPAFWRAYPQQALEILRFLHGMCEAPFVFRRISAPRLSRTSGTAEDGRYVHSMMHVGVRLKQGTVMLGIRFHDARTAENLFLTGNYVHFGHRGKPYTLDVEDAIAEVSGREEKGVLVAHHGSDLRFSPDGAPQPLGRITYTYRIDARTMLVQVEAALEIAPGVEIEDVILTIGHDNLSHGRNNVHYGRVGILSPAGAVAWHVADKDGNVTLPATGAEYYSLAQEEMRGFALGVHTRSLTPGNLHELRVVQKQKRLHWVVAAYRFPGAHRGTRLVAAEDKLLTAGGFYDEAAEYLRLMRQASDMPPDAWPRDLSISYDYGVEINAFAKAHAMFASGEVEAPPGLADEMRRMTDRYLEVYDAQFVRAFWDGKNTVFCRQLAFVILAVATMMRSTGEEQYRKRLADLVEVLLQFQVTLPGDIAGPETGFLMGVRSVRDMHVDCQSAALLALIHAAPWLPDERIAAAIDRGLNAYALVTGRFMWAEKPRKVDTVGIHWKDGGGKPRLSMAFWNFHAGLTLRMLRALRQSPVVTLRSIEARHADRLDMIETVLLRQLARATQAREEGLEVRCSSLSAETNSETQPWVVLGFVGNPHD